MEPAVDLPEPAQLDAGVDLGRGDRGVAEHLLDDAEVGAAGEQVGGEAVPERVRADRLAGSPAARAWLLTIRQSPTRDSGRPVRETKTVARLGRARDQRGAVVAQVGRQGLAGPRAERDDPLLVPLADAPGRCPRSRSRSAGRRPTTSEARQPVA